MESSYNALYLHANETSFCTNEPIWMIWFISDVYMMSWTMTSCDYEQRISRVRALYTGARLRCVCLSRTVSEIYLQFITQDKCVTRTWRRRNYGLPAGKAERNNAGLCQQEMWVQQLLFLQCNEGYEYYVSLCVRKLYHWVRLKRFSFKLLNVQYWVGYKQKTLTIG